MRLLNFLLPPKCLVCSTVIEKTGGLCHLCWSNLQFIGSPACNLCDLPFEYKSDIKAICGQCSEEKPLYDKAKSVLIYNDYSAKLVTDLKYSDKTYGAVTYAKWMENHGKELIEKSDYIVPVPIHKRRLFKRKYNQSALLAKKIAKLSGKKFAPEILLRVKNTPPQASLNTRNRKHNIKGCFAINSKYNIKNSSILLIDDVITTGSTIKECSKILKNSGAKNIYVLTLTKTLK